MLLLLLWLLLWLLLLLLLWLLWLLLLRRLRTEAIFSLVTISNAAPKIFFFALFVGVSTHCDVGWFRRNKTSSSILLGTPCSEKSRFRSFDSLFDTDLLVLCWL
jgi:hypothetical protein